MKHLDGKGHHPGARPYHRHALYRLKKQIVQNLQSYAQRLAMMRLGLHFVRFAKGEASPLFVAADMTAPEGQMVMEMFGGTPCECYVDTDGYGMLQANEAEPPPKAETTKGLIEKLSDLKHILMRIAAIMMLVLTLPFVACHKDSTPTPTPTPDPDTTIIEPPVDTVTYPDTVYLKWDWEWRAPPMDSVIFFAQKNSVKKIILELLPFNSGSYTPEIFHYGRNKLQERIDVNPQKVRGAGKIYVNRTYGASLPDPTETNKCGMAAVDSAWYVQNGWQIQRGRPPYKSR